MLQIKILFRYLYILRKVIYKLFKGTFMQMEKVLINDRLRVSKVSRKLCIPTIYNFAVIYP